MSYTPYDDSIPVAQDALRSLMGILKVGEQQPNSADLPAARLHHDMLPLTFQVEIVTDTAVKMLARLSGSEPVSFKGKLSTFTDMCNRIEEAQRVLSTGSRDLINSRVNETVTMGVSHDGKRAQFPGSALIFGYSLPTIFFHVAIAYGIMRKEGVPLTKETYLESFGDRFNAVYNTTADKH
jgi:hypothetical protein